MHSLISYMQRFEAGRVGAVRVSSDINRRPADCVKPQMANRFSITSRPSHLPAEQDPGGGLRSPRKDRGGNESDRSGEGRPLAGCRSNGVRQARPPWCDAVFGLLLRRRGLANGVRNATALPARGAEAPTLAARLTSDPGARSLLMQPA